MKHISFVFASIILFACSQQPKTDYKTVKGYAQGTTYSITYQDSLDRDFKEAIDSILMHFDGALSNYISESNLKQANASDTVVLLTDTFGYFSDVFLQSMLLYKKTEGAFNPAIWPLVNTWGFGTDKVDKEPEGLDSLIKLANFNDVLIYVQATEEGYLNIKLNKGKYQQFDFNAIAQGASVDVVFDFFEKQGIKNKLVEIGGELRASGVNPKGEIWRLGIDKPEEYVDGRPLQAILKLNSAALATSGNYRKFSWLDGKKVTHTINPETGKPAAHNLLSATVMATTAAKADAYATAFMVMGFEKAKNFLESQTEIQAYLIAAKTDTTYDTFVSHRLTEMLEVLD